MRKKDFEENILVHIYYNHILLFDENEKYFQIKLNVSEFENYSNETCQIFQYKIENIIKDDLINKLKSKIDNVVKISRLHKIPVKNILQTLFINNSSQNIEIIWSPSALKEFQYVPTKHYIQHKDDSLVLKVKSIKFHS